MMVGEYALALGQFAAAGSADPGLPERLVAAAGPFRERVQQSPDEASPGATITDSPEAVIESLGMAAQGMKVSPAVQERLWRELGLHVGTGLGDVLRKALACQLDPSGATPPTADEVCSMVRTSSRDGRRRRAELAVVALRLRNAPAATVQALITELYARWEREAEPELRIAIGSLLVELRRNQPH
jgi:hypothetical protein